MLKYIFEFKTANYSYFYDGITNHIVRVSDVLRDVIHAEIIRDIKDCSNIYSKYSRRIINSAYKSLKILQDKYKIFRNEKFKIKGFTLPFDINEENLKLFINENNKKLSLGITEQCNLRCAYCTYSGKYYKERVHSNKFMNFEIAKKAVDFFMNISNNKRKLINFYGGEPLLNFDLIKEVVNYCSITYKSKSYIFSLSTNGTLIDENIASFLIKNDFLCYISLDGPEDVHDIYRTNTKGQGTFEKIMTNLRLIKSLNEKYYKKNVIFLITLAPPYDLIKIKEFFSQNELVKENLYLVNTVNTNDTIFFEDKNPNDWKLEESIKVMKEELLENLSEKDIRGLTFHIRYFLELLIRIHKRKMHLENSFYYPNGICIPGGRRFFVNTEGEFKICEKLDNFLSIGDVYSGFYFSQIKYLLKKYISFCNKDCVNCWALSLCDLCFVHANNVEDINIEERRKFCEKIRKRYAKGLVLYATLFEKNSSFFELLTNEDNWRMNNEI